MKEIPNKENIWSNLEIFQTQNRDGTFTTSLIVKNDFSLETKTLIISKNDSKKDLTKFKDESKY